MPLAQIRLEPETEYDNLAVLGHPNTGHQKGNYGLRRKREKKDDNNSSKS